MAYEISLVPLSWQQLDSLFARCPITGQAFTISFDQGKHWASWDASLPGADEPAPLQAAAEALRAARVMPELRIAKIE